MKVRSRWMDITSEYETRGCLYVAWIPRLAMRWARACFRASVLCNRILCFETLHSIYFAIEYFNQHQMVHVYVWLPVRVCHLQRYMCNHWVAFAIIVTLAATCEIQQQDASVLRTALVHFRMHRQNPYWLMKVQLQTLWQQQFIQPNVIKTAHVETRIK